MSVTTITSADVVTEFGSYYLDNGQNVDLLKMRPFEEFGTMDAFTVIDTGMETILRLSDVQVGEIIQPYQDAFTPKGSVTFEPIQIPLQQMKIDQQFNPSKLANSWLGFLTSNNTDRTTWPFTKWMLEVYLMKQSKKDYELSLIYTGSAASPTAGTAGAASTSMDGVKKLINAGITASTITPITLGTLSTTPATFCTQIETFVASIPEVYWKENMVINMSRTLRNRYRAGRRAKYNMYFAQFTDLDQVADFENISVVGRASQVGSVKIWMTPKYNAIMGVKGFSNINGFEVEKVDRNVKVYTDWWAGIGFLMNDLMWTNDSELPS